MAALGVCLVLGACANPFSREPEQTGRDLLASHARTPGAPPIVVPRTLPGGYGMLWANQFFPAGRNDLPGVDVCVAPSKQQIEGSCVGTEDDSPWVTIDVEGHIVVLSTMSTPERAAFLAPWQELEWTTDWESVAWVDQTFEEQSAGP